MFRKFQKGKARLFRLRHFESLANDFRDVVRLPDLCRVLGDGLKKLYQVQVLMALLVHAARIRLPRQRQAKLNVRVGYARDELASLSFFQANQSVVFHRLERAR